MLKLFKIVALLEGVSLLALFFFAMPMKYWLGDITYIRPIGMAHGVLFIGYIILSVMLKMEQNWSTKKLLIICLASIVPGGTFYVDWKYLQKTSSAEL